MINVHTHFMAQRILRSVGSIIAARLVASHIYNIGIVGLIFAICIVAHIDLSRNIWIRAAH